MTQPHGEIVRRLVEATMSFCEPENADEAASEYSCQYLSKKFSEILDSEPPVAWRCRTTDEPGWQYGETKLKAKDLFRKEPGFEEQPLSRGHSERTGDRS
jgi:hypothetical protein